MLSFTTSSNRNLSSTITDQLRKAVSRQVKAESELAIIQQMVADMGALVVDFDAEDQRKQEEKKKTVCLQLPWDKVQSVLGALEEVDGEGVEVLREQLRDASSQMNERMME